MKQEVIKPRASTYVTLNSEEVQVAVYYYLDKHRAKLDSLPDRYSNRQLKFKFYNDHAGGTTVKVSWEIPE